MAATQVRCFADLKKDAQEANQQQKEWVQKGASNEKSYFSKEDEVLMKQLLRKMEKQADSEVVTKQNDKLALERLFRKWGVPESNSLKEDLIDWKHA